MAIASKRRSTQPLRHPRPFRSIAGTLIRSTLALALLCMLLVFGAQTWFMVRSHSQQFQETVDDIATTAVPLLSVGLWDIESKTVQQQVDLIAQRPQIGHVHLKSTVGKEFSAGRTELRGAPVSLRIPIPAPPHAPNGANTIVGELSITGNQQYLLDQVWHNAWTVFMGYGAFTVALCGFIIFMLRRELQQPLQRLARFAAALTPETLTTPVELPRPPRGATDEIDQLVDGFSKLQWGLREHIDELDRKVEERTAQLRDLAEANRVLSITDDLTGCLNRRTLEERLREETGRCRRYGRNLSVICTDIDHFKRINDTHGHAGGDTVLREVGALLRKTARVGVDWTVRMGGEEFLLVLPETDLRAATSFARRLHQALASLAVSHAGQTIHLTASMGVAQLRPDEDGQALILRADALLYAAKNAGRNQVQYEAPIPRPTQPAALAAL